MTWQLIFEDNFARNGSLNGSTPDIGHKWSTHRGRITTNGSNAIGTTVNSNAPFASAYVGTWERRFVEIVVAGQIMGNGSGCIVLDVIDMDNYWYTDWSPHYLYEPLLIADNQIVTVTNGVKTSPAGTPWTEHYDPSSGTENWVTWHEEDNTHTGVTFNKFGTLFAKQTDMETRYGTDLPNVTWDPAFSGFTIIQSPLESAGRIGILMLNPTYGAGIVRIRVWGDTRTDSDPTNPDENPWINPDPEPTGTVTPPLHVTRADQYGAGGAARHTKNTRQTSLRLRAPL